MIGEKPLSSKEIQKRYWFKHRKEINEKQRKYYQEHLEQERERSREYMRQYCKTHPEYMRHHKEFARHRKTHLVDNPESKKEREKKYYENNLEKRYAKSRAYRCISLASHCEICDSDKNLQRHHFDYSKPLDVHTFCRNCHYKIHVILRDITYSKYVYLLFGEC